MSHIQPGDRVRVRRPDREFDGLVGELLEINHDPIVTDYSDGTSDIDDDVEDDYVVLLDRDIIEGALCQVHAFRAHELVWLP